jgi:hypothetical protein
MAIFLKKFETISQYNAYTADTENFILPNVSLTVDNNTVHYNPSTPPTPSHDFVEIGGVKWATMNVGANSVTDGGLYFQWADTQGYTAAQVGTDKQFTLSDYKYYDEISDSMTKYNDEDGLATIQASDDAVTAAWGGNWRMPTASEWEALGEAVNTAWTVDYQGSGVAGVVLTDKTDSSKTLFFPAVGCVYDGTFSVGDLYCHSSSLITESGCMKMYYMYCGGSEYGVSWSADGLIRSSGLNIRGILDE